MSTSDASAAIGFLENIQPDGPWVLTAIVPDGRTVTQSFTSSNVAALRSFIKKHDGQLNIYYSINEPKGLPTKKLSKADMQRARFLHVDIDPRNDESSATAKVRILSAVEKFSPQPTAIIDSGNGIQILFRLEQPVTLNPESIADIENRNFVLAQAFDCDPSTRNVDRIFRLPGTTNLPNKKKRSVGRVPCATKVLSFTGAAHPLTTFPATSSKAAFDVDALPVPPRIKKLIRGSDHIMHSYRSRSERVFAVLIAMLAGGCTDEQMAALMFDPSLPVGLKVREHADSVNYLKRQILKARKIVTATSPDEFVTDAHGKPYTQNQENTRVALKKLGVRVRHDTFADRLFIDGLEGVGPLFDDRAIDRLWLTIDSTFNFRANRDFFFRVVIDEARRNSFHPVHDYLNGLEWDDQSRIDTWLIEYAGADDTPYVRAVSALFLIAAVRRILKPGCKFDEMLVLESPQGGDKSTGLQTLAVNPDWFSDDLPLNAEGKKVIESLSGHWIIEASELKGMRRGDIEGLKAFLSRQVDRARMSYDRTVTEAPRQCVIFGTTNSSQYLRDNTGNRRFWPVAVKPFDIKALTRARDQLWAEAVVREADGVSIRLDPALYAVAEEQQQMRLVEDPFVGTISRVLGDMNGKILTADVLCALNIPTGQQSQDHNARMGDAMRLLGWERKQRRFGNGNPGWCYVRGGDERQIIIHNLDGDIYASYDKAAEADRSQPPKGARLV